MAIFCIPKNLIEKLKKSALKGEVDIKKLYDMSSAERRAFFEKHTDTQLGKFINSEFEKAMISKQKTAITDWAKSVFTPEAKTKPVYKNILDKINSLDDMGVLTPKTEQVFLEDLVSDKLGINVSPEEVRIISEKAKIIDGAQEKLGNDLGSPSKLQENLDFFKAKKAMDDYLQGLTPASKLKVLTGTIGRASMLFSLKSPILNIGSNLEVGFTEAISRRLAGGQFRGTNYKLALDYVKMTNKIYQATGYDISRMMSLNEGGASGARVLGDTVHSQGEGIIRKFGRGFEYVVFKQLMGAPDVAFSSAHFADSVNLNSFKMAKGDKAKAEVMMNDAMRLEPQTPEGEILKAQGVMDAQVATWTDRSWASKVSEGFRKILNNVSGDARMGDYLLPFVKTPANVIATGMDYAGVGAVRALFNTVKLIRSGEGFKNKIQTKNITRGLVRSGLGIVGAFVISQQLKDDDFVGAYDPARAQIESLRNSNENSFRAGNKWISTDWLGPLAVPFTAMMYARKYRKSGLREKMFQYAQGVVSQAQNIPGVKDFSDYAQTKSYKKDQSLEEMTGETAGYVSEQIWSRLTPSFISDAAKAMDTVDRNTKGNTAGLIPNTIINKIPGLRQTLPEKKNIFGETVTGEPAWSDIVFGARVKTSKETAVIKEISDVSVAVDKSIAFTDWDKSSSKTLTQFKEKVGQAKFDEAKIKYGQELKKKLEDTIKNPRYQKLNSEDKLKVINGFDSEAMDKIFKQYGFKYKSAPTTKIKL